MSKKSKSFLLAGLTLSMTSVGLLAQETVVKVGYTGPLSGGAAYFGKDHENGVALAIAELNDKKLTVAGKKVTFQLQSEDDQCDPKAGVAVAQKLADSGIKFVFGPSCSGVAIPASKVYSDSGVLVFTAASNPKVTQGGHKNLFRITGSDDQIGVVMANYAAKEMKAKTVGLVDDRSAFGQGVADEFQKEATRLGVKVVGREYTSATAVDFSSILTTLKSKHPDAIFFGGYPAQGGPLLRQMKQMGVAVKLLAPDAMCNEETSKLAGDSSAVNDILYCAQFGAMVKGADDAAYKARYKQRFNQESPAYSASFYDQMMFLAASMQKTNSLDPTKVAEEMHNAAHKGIAANYTYDQYGNLQKAPATVFTFKNGALIPLSSM